MTSEPGFDRRPILLASLVIVATMLGVSAWAWGQLPPGASVPVHWDVNGEPNGYAPKEVALLISPVLGLLLTGLFWVLPRVEPRRLHLLGSGRAYGALWLAALLLVLGVHVVTTLAVAGHAVAVGQWVLAGVGALFVVIGAVLPGVQSNFLLGIRTPWTLSSERSWRLTHRVGGLLFAAFGVAFVLVALLGAGGAALAVVFVAGAVALALLVAYSYLVWRSDPDRDSFGR